MDLLLYKRQINAAIKLVEQSVVASTTNNIGTLVKENDSKGEMIFKDLETIYTTHSPTIQEITNILLSKSLEAKSNNDRVGLGDKKRV